MMDTKSYIALAVFLAAYALISSEKLHRMKAALAGAVLMVILGILPQSQAISAIDFSTIFLLMGMMVIVNIMRETGFFEFVAILGVRAAKGVPWRLLVILSVLTAVVSAFLDNVTTVLLFTPIVLFVAETLRIKVFPYLVAVIFAANIGGMATLIGAPPNIMIGSATGFTFSEFLIHIFPITVIIFAANIGFLWLVFHKKLSSEAIEEVMNLDASRAIKNKDLLVRCLIVLTLTIVGFVLHHILGLQPATVALAGSALLLILVKGNPIEYLEKIEWNTLFFFAGLFVMVGGLEASGVIHSIFEWTTSKTESVPILSGGFLFGGALVCSFMDNIPFTAMMIPLVQKITTHFGDPAISKALWWSLAIGVNIGGNGTIIAASPNIVVSGIAEQSRNRISFGQYFAYGMGSVVISAALGFVYVWLRYF